MSNSGDHERAQTHTDAIGGTPVAGSLTDDKPAQHAASTVATLWARAQDGVRALGKPPKTPAPRDVPSYWEGKREWLVPIGVVAVAAALRLIGLEHPHALVFDETYYVKDGWSILHLGYEASWPEDPDARFAAGETDIYQTNGTRVVHPPLGKWLIGLGMALFGGDSSFGWRFATAIAGILTVLVTYLIARRLTGSVAWAGFASLMLAVDGLSIVLSRVALLDGILTFFIMLGVLFIVYDHRAAMARIMLDDDIIAGPTMWRRPWLIAAGAALGAASAVKWSGLFVLAGFGIALVVSDALARRRAGVRMWASAAIGRQAPATFMLLVPVALLVYVSSWTGWLLSTDAYGRNTDPNPFIALWNYHLSSMSFHVGLTSTHAYASPAWQWPFLVRPTSMYWDGTEDNSVVQAITSLPNPILWWVGCAAAVALIGMFAVARDWRMAVVLTGLATTYLPWLAVPQRTIFQFYTVAMMPFLMLAIALLLQHIIGPPDPDRYTHQRRWTIAARVFAVVAVLVSAFYLPVWTAMPVPHWFWWIHMWLPTWI